MTPLINNHPAPTAALATRLLCDAIVHDAPIQVILDGERVVRALRRAEADAARQQRQQARTLPAASRVLATTARHLLGATA